MEKLLVFTNARQIWNVDNEVHQKIPGMGTISKDNPFQAFIDGELIPANSLIEGSLFFVFDGLTQESYNKYHQTKHSQDEIYVLYHKKNSHFKIIFNKQEICLLGKHTSNPVDIYIELLEMLIDVTISNKTDRIIDLLFVSKDRQTLKFLVDCEQGTPPLPARIKDKTIISLYNTWVANKTPKNYSILRSEISKWADSDTI